MPVIDPIPWDDLDPELRQEIASGQASRMLTSSLPVQIWAHRPRAATAWVRTLGELHRGPLDARLRELVRLRIADFTQCRTCQIARKTDDVSEEEVSCLSSEDPRFTPRERAALRFAELFAGDHFAIDDTVFAELGRHFDVQEIVELGMFTALMLAGGRLTYVLRGYADDERPALFPHDAPASENQRE